MRLRLKLALAAVFFVAGMATVSFAFSLLDMKSDLAAVSGFLLLMVSFVLYPTVFIKIISHHKVNREK